jgi:hypothetical protein
VLLQDPAIKEMAEKIANDPSFQGLTSQLQESMSSMVNPSGGAPAAPPDLAGFDPSKYMQAMSGMFQNQQFMAMAEKLGQAIIQVRLTGVQPLHPKYACLQAQLLTPCPLVPACLQSDPNMQRMMQTMQDPDYKTKVEGAMAKLKDDPEMGPIIEELQSGGPAAMMK